VAFRPDRRASLPADRTTVSAGLLERPTFEPVCIGPTWQRVPDWTPDLPEQDWYVLPEITLGWEIISWVERYLLDDQGDPFTLTFEQKRFLLWWYELDERGRFVSRHGVLQRLKGWGKDPLAAVLAAVEFIGPCRFSHWAVEDDPLRDIVAGDPVGMEHPRAWIQIAAVSKDQTRNTMTLFPGLFSKKLMALHGMRGDSIGKEIIYAHGGQRRIEAVTSSPRALEGGRPTFVIRNETHHWLANNEGHEMDKVIVRNLVKAKGGQARALSITNAYEPSEDSVAQRQREAYENEQAGLAIKTGILYDSLEASADAKMGFDPGTPEEEVKAYIGAVVSAVRGNADWLDVEGIVAAILDTSNNPPSQSRRFYYNQIVATEDAWLLPEAAKAAIDPLAADARRQVGADPLRAGCLVMPGEEVVSFFDGSKSDDATALMGCRLDDGYVFTIGVWQKPPGEAGKLWTVPRHEVDNRVVEMMERFNVVAFWGDPSHTKDDDASRYWDGLLDDWHRRYKDKLQYWSTKTGDRQHAIVWDMASPEKTAQFTAAAELFVEELENEGDEGFDSAFRIDGHPALMDHLRNAKKLPTKWGTSLWKGHRESSKKVDLAVAAVGARMLRRLILNKGLEEEKKKGGSFWGA
jgi:hypothetical protein